MNIDKKKDVNHNDWYEQYSFSTDKISINENFERALEHVFQYLNIFLIIFLTSVKEEISSDFSGFINVKII